jgi:hypothetical protein
MFFYTKLALVTCAFYVGAAILLDAGIFGMALWKGGFSISATKSGWIVLFGSAWLSSFLLSWRIVMDPILAQIAKFRGAMHP